MFTGYYSEELKQRWSNIPIGYKAQTLLNMDDPDILDLKPAKGNPLIWENAEGVEVMYFEYYTNPTREANREHYYRQLLMGRWQCKKSVIDQLLMDLNLTLYIADRIEPMNERYI